MKVLGSSDERFGYVKEKHDNDMYKVEFPDNITTMTRADLQLAAAEDKIRPGVMVKFKAALAEPGARPTHGWGDNVTASSVGKVVEVGDCVVIDFCGYRGFKAKLKDVELYEAKKGRCPANHALSSSHGVRPSAVCDMCFQNCSGGGGGSHHCAACDFDICARCARVALQPSRPASSVTHVVPTTTTPSTTTTAAAATMTGPSSPSSTSDDSLINKKVRTTALANPNMNGQLGTVQTFDVASNRYYVVLESGTKVSLKREKFELVRTELPPLPSAPHSSYSSYSSSSSSSSPSTGGQLAIGTEIYLTGLVGPEKMMNDLPGVVTAFDASKNEYTVCTSNMKVAFFKREHLQLKSESSNGPFGGGRAELGPIS